VDKKCERGKTEVSNHENHSQALLSAAPDAKSGTWIKVRMVRLLMDVLLVVVLTDAFSHCKSD